MITLAGMFTLQQLFDTYQSRVKKVTSKSVRSDRIGCREKLNWSTCYWKSMDIIFGLLEKFQRGSGLCCIIFEKTLLVMSG